MFAPDDGVCADAVGVDDGATGVEDDAGGCEDEVAGREVCFLGGCADLWPFFASRCSLCSSHNRACLRVSPSCLFSREYVWLFLA